MKKLSIGHIHSLIDNKQFITHPNVVICQLDVGDSSIVGTSHKFSNDTYDLEAAQGSAYKNAENQLFGLEAYHQKRLRSIRAEVYNQIGKNIEHPDFDVHKWTASLILGISEDQVSDEDRKFAKQINMKIHAKINSIQS